MKRTSPILLSWSYQNNWKDYLLSVPDCNRDGLIQWLDGHITYRRNMHFEKKKIQLYHSLTILISVSWVHIKSSKNRYKLILVMYQENHSLLHTIVCFLRCPISKENDWQVQGLTFFCYVIIHRHALKLTNHCKRNRNKRLLLLLLLLL